MIFKQKHRLFVIRSEICTEHNIIFNSKFVAPYSKPILSFYQVWRRFSFKNFKMHSRLPVQLWLIKRVGEDQSTVLEFTYRSWRTVALLFTAPCSSPMEKWNINQCCCKLKSKMAYMKNLINNNLFLVFSRVILRFFIVLKCDHGYCKEFETL